MPALAPRWAMAVSQLPRWPVESLRESSAVAPFGSGKSAAQATAQHKRPRRFIVFVLRLSSSPLDGFEVAQPADQRIHADRQHEYDDQQGIHARHVEGGVAVDDEEA